MILPTYVTQALALPLADLPALGAPMAGGLFAGLTTQPDGTHVAVVLLPGRGECLTWQQSMDWAAQQGGQLPSRPIAALLFANVSDRPQVGWHWTCETHANDASYAWYCYFTSGSQLNGHKSAEACAVAVRLIPVGTQP